jgi:hypothetical protein
VQSDAGRGSGQHADFLLSADQLEFQSPVANWTVQRRQFPLRLAYAATFNSCQGLTLNRVVLETKPVFAHGQLHNSLSRVRSGSDIRFLRCPGERGVPMPNMVYRILLTEDGEDAMSVAE